MVKRTAAPKKEDYKIKGSKGSAARIKACPCAKPLVTMNFKAPPFQGKCCVECFEIESYQLIPPPDDNNQSNEGGDGINAGTTPSNDENGPTDVAGDTEFIYF